MANNVTFKVSFEQLNEAGTAKLKRCSPDSKMTIVILEICLSMVRRVLPPMKTPTLVTGTMKMLAQSGAILKSTMMIIFLGEVLGLPPSGATVASRTTSQGR